MEGFYSLVLHALAERPLPDSDAQVPHTDPDRDPVVLRIRSAFEHGTLALRDLGSLPGTHTSLPLKRALWFAAELTWQLEKAPDQRHPILMARSTAR